MFCPEIGLHKSVKIWKDIQKNAIQNGNLYIQKNLKDSADIINNSILLNTNSLCGYNNTLYTTINAPKTLNQIISSTINYTYGGEYVRVNNLIAGNAHRISTIGTNTFDTVISIFLAGVEILYHIIIIGTQVHNLNFNPFFR